MPDRRIVGIGKPPTVSEWTYAQLQVLETEVRQQYEDAIRRLNEIRELLPVRWQVEDGQKLYKLTWVIAPPQGHGTRGNPDETFYLYAKDAEDALLPFRSDTARGFTLKVELVMKCCNCGHTCEQCAPVTNATTDRLDSESPNSDPAKALRERNFLRINDPRNDVTQEALDRPNPNE